MPKTPDFTQVAHRVFQQAVGEAEKDESSPMKAARQKAGTKGGTTRAANLTPAQRAEIARTAASARWKKGT